MALKSEKILNLPTGIPVPSLKCGSEAVRCKPVSLRAPLISIPKRRLCTGIAAAHGSHHKMALDSVS
ncbi:MAG: hypothetical protein CVU57_17925 [Deltaproteobacteria bacterium HGW-Deltaproteobacteria-15]|nr:MAG: hypothetical protein CVU57_17925 [Deltaproteobacteria bacterium HGW-Deltaproteobacteria-15]